MNKETKFVNAARPKRQPRQEMGFVGWGIYVVDDEERESPLEAGEHEPGEEFGERKTIRNHGPHQPGEQERAETREDAHSIPQLLQTLHQSKITERSIVARRSRRKDKSQRCTWTPRAWVTSRKEKRWHSWL